MRALLASPLGFLVGVSLGALGGGGSVLAIPVLVYGAGQGPRAATATSLLVVGSSALVGMVAHWRSGHVRLGIGLVFGAMGVGGSVAGSVLNRALDPDVLMLAFSAVIAGVAWRMWRSSGAHPSAAGADIAHRRPLDARLAVDVAVAGSLIGFLTGLFGVGGGFVLVPALVLVLRFPMPDAVGTSLLVIAINAAIALSQRLSTTGIEWRVALPFTVAGLLGAGVGKRVADRTLPSTLARAFVVLLAVVAAYTAIRSALALV